MTRRIGGLVLPALLLVGLAWQGHRALAQDQVTISPEAKHSLAGPLLARSASSVQADGVPWNPENVTIEVFRGHERGSGIPARVERWDLLRYTAAVMYSGAWPARPRESARVGAIAIRQYATWHMRHWQRGYVWRGNRYDIRDNDQHIKRHLRPWHRMPARFMRIARETRTIRLYKNGRYFRTGWRGGFGRDGWHIFEDTTRHLAHHRNWGWRRILRHQLAPVTIKGELR